jgi:hypothetical protein
MRGLFASLNGGRQRSLEVGIIALLLKFDKSLQSTASPVSKKTLKAAGSVLLDSSQVCWRLPT